MSQRAEQLKSGFRLYDLIVLPSRNLIKRSDGEQHLEPKAMKVLMLLAEHPYTVLLRQEILDKIWPDTYSGDESLTRSISLLRSCLGESKQGNRFIETVSKSGYRLIAPIKVSIANENSAAKLPKKQLLIGFALTVFVLIIMLTTFFDIQLSENKKVYIASKNLAVLPFINTKPNTDTDYLGFALADQIIGELLYLESINVRPSGVIRKYMNQAIDPAAVAKELNVDYVLTGNYLTQENIVRLNVELINVAVNELIWRESIEINYSNTFELQDIVTRMVASRLNSTLTPDNVKRTYKDTPNDPLAYEYYLRSISYPYTREGHQLAIDMLEKSILLDANYAPSYAHLGKHKRLLAQHFKITNDESSDAEGYYLKALSLNLELLDALANLSTFYTEINRIEEAYVLAKKMNEINSNSAKTHFTLGYLFRYAGMINEAMQEMEIALSIDPGNPTFRSIVATYISAGEYEKALSMVHLDYESAFQYGFKGIIAFHQQDITEAMHNFKLSKEIDDPTGVWGLVADIYIATIQGDNIKGIEAVKKIVDINIIDGENTYYIAVFYALLGDHKASIKSLRKAVNTGYFNYHHISSDTAFDLISDDAEFIDILARAKQRHLAFKDRFFNP